MEEAGHTPVVYLPLVPVNPGELSSPQHQETTPRGTEQASQHSRGAEYNDKASLVADMLPTNPLLPWHGWASWTEELTPPGRKVPQEALGAEGELHHPHHQQRGSMSQHCLGVQGWQAHGHPHAVPCTLQETAQVNMAKGSALNKSQCYRKKGLKGKENIGMS